MIDDEDYGDGVDERIPIKYTSGKRVIWANFTRNVRQEQPACRMRLEASPREQAGCGSPARGREEVPRALRERSRRSVIYNPTRPILAANPAACAMFGMSEEEIFPLDRQGLGRPG